MASPLAKSMGILGSNTHQLIFQDHTVSGGFHLIEVMGNVSSSDLMLNTIIWDDDGGRHMFFSKKTSSFQFRQVCYFARLYVHMFVC